LRSSAIKYYLAVVLGLALLLVAGSDAWAAPPLQEADDATLRIINDSEQTICYIVIVAVTDTSGENATLSDDVLELGEEAVFALPADDYHIVLLDCNQDTLLVELNVPLVGTYELHFTGPDLCGPLNQEGMTLLHQARYYDALQHFRAALTCYREVDDREDEGTALNNIGGVYDRLGQYQEALDYFRQALAIRQEIGDRAGEGVTLNNIGLIYHYLGQYQEALDTSQQALGIHQEIGDRAGEGGSLNNIGLIYHHLGQYQEALDTYQQALAILKEIDDRAGEGVTLNNIGGIYSRLGQYQESLDTYQQALAILQEIGDRAGESASLNNIGYIYDSLGQYQEALDSYQRALAIRKEIGDRAGEGISLNNIGSIYSRLGQYQEALDTYQQALAIRKEIGDRAGEGITLTNIGFVYERQDQPEQALRYYDQAMIVLEAVRAIAGSEAGRASFIGQYANLYHRAVNLYHVQGEVDQAFLTTERGRARAFLDAMATGYVQLSDADADDLLTQEQAAHAARQAAQTALSRARAQQPPDTALIAELEAQLAAAEAEHAAALTKIEACHDQLAALVPGRSAVLNLPQVQALLDEQTTLVSFWVLEDQTLAFVVTREDFDTVALPVSQADLVTQITGLLGFPNLDVAHPESAVTLYAGLVAPLKDHLPSASLGHLVIVPHNVLHYLPFAALTDGQRYLVDDYTLTYLPSASVLPFIQANASTTLSTGSGGEEGEPLILGNPTTGDFDTTASLAAERDQLGPLPFAEQEAQAIAALYGTTPLIGAAATESVVRGQSGEVGILHLAAHGHYNPVAPLHSLIALAPDEVNDGWLTVGEVYGLDLQGADLVVLSACQSHLGDLSAGDELVGLTRAFFYAGTPTVVASLWTVDDQATALLMERFYTHLRAGIDKAQALRQAQLDIRAEYPNPYYWAGFVLSGDGGEGERIEGVKESIESVTGSGTVEDVKETESTTDSVITWPWVVLFLVAVVGGGVLAWRRRG
jgi:CHAT domain-containing protein/tetratricopeptide (TPR) repeat protein